MPVSQQASPCGTTNDYIPPVSSSILPQEIQIDLAAIPDHVRDDLAAATFECVKNFLRQPGGKEFLDARIAAKKTAVAAARQASQKERAKEESNVLQNVP